MKFEQSSLNDINAKKNQKSLASIHLAKALQQLDIRYNPNDEEDQKQLGMILGDILQYPNQQLAQLHREAMRLGNFDIQKQNQAISKTQAKQSIIAQGKNRQFCLCCGFVRQQEQIKLNTQLQKIVNLGTSTQLYFRSFTIFIILLIIMTLVYSCFAIITNVLAASQYKKQPTSQVIDYLTISLSSKQLDPTQTNKRYYYASCWLGLLMVIIWFIVFLVSQYSQIKKVQQVDSDTSSASDFSITLQNMPYNIKLQDLQKYFNQYHANKIRSNNNYPQVWRKNLKIAAISIGKPFYLQKQNQDQELKKLNNQSLQIRDKIIVLLMQRKQQINFKTPKNQRTTLYENLMKNRQKIQKRSLQLLQNLKKQATQTSQQHLTTIFVTFESNYNKQIFLALHEKGLLSKLIAILKTDQQQFSFVHNQRRYMPIIRSAPQPQDIIWINIGLSQCSLIIKKITTFSVTLVLLGTCFAIVYGLTKAQQSASDNRVLSMVISFTISFVNFVLGQVIRRLTFLQRDYTSTYYQASLSIKIILAQIVNTVIIPVITAYKIKNNVYQTSGLVDNIFILALNMSFLTPIMYYFDVYTLFLKVLKCYNSKSENKLKLNQKKFNSFFEGPQFQVGYNSIYGATLLAFTCFYVSLQPIISVFALFGLVLMYWVQKYLLFTRYKRPIPGTDFVNLTIFRVIKFCPIIYSFGSLTWANLSPDGTPAYALIPNLIALGISLVIFLVPFKTIVNGCINSQTKKQQIYSEERIFIPSQYKMLNPMTQQKAIIQHKQYIKNKLQSISKELSKQKQEEQMRKMANNFKRAQLYQNQNQNTGNDFFNMFSGQNNFGNVNSMSYANFQPVYNPMQNFQQFMPSMGFVSPQIFNPYFDGNMMMSGMISPQMQSNPMMPQMRGPPNVPYQNQYPQQGFGNVNIVNNPYNMMANFQNNNNNNNIMMNPFGFNPYRGW